MAMMGMVVDPRPLTNPLLPRFRLPRLLTSLCARGAPVLALLCASCGYTGVNSYFYKTVDFTPHTNSKDQVLVLLANTAPTAEHYHVGEVKVTRGMMDSDAALYDAMRDLGVKYGFDGVNDISCGEQYSVNEPYVCTGAAFIIKEPPQAAASGGTDAPQVVYAEGTSYAEEDVDFGVKPQRELQTNVGSPTPTRLPSDVGKTLSTQELGRLISNSKEVLLVDVLNGDHKYTIKNTFYLPDGGQPGNLSDQHQQHFAEELQFLSRERTDTPIVLFCLGARCWESYNAALRAYHAGYRDIYWYRGGINAWMEAGNPVEPLADVLEDMDTMGAVFPF